MSVTAPIVVPHVIRGVTHLPSPDDQVDYGGFVTPRLDLDELVWERTEPGPAFDVPLTEIIDFLQAVGDRLDLETNPHLQAALEASPSSDLGARLMGMFYGGLRHQFDPDLLRFQVEQEVGWDYLDGWKGIEDLQGRVRRVRAFPPRLAYILAGNSPTVTAGAITRGALTKGVHLLKLPSNDLLTGPAILRTMAEVDATHPITQSFSCVYWRGGDTTIEGALFRAQFFDRLVVWGGDAAVQGALRYVAPGFDLVSFDPKLSASLVGREALQSVEAMQESADAAATDATLMNQQVCSAARFIYVEGDRSEVAKWCEVLAHEIAQPRLMADAIVGGLTAEVKSEINALRSLAPLYEVFGKDDGSGLVILSDEPVDFNPTAKTVNVVCVPDLQDALEYINVGTQTVGIYPHERAAELRDGLCSRGAQRLVPLGGVAAGGVAGFPHDGFKPLHRLMKWLVDES